MFTNFNFKACGVESNIWKMFIYILTSRRAFIPLMSIYFLTLDNTLANQIGLYTGIGSLVGFLIEMPSGYISDTFGHKKTLILSKFFMLFSTLFLILAATFDAFIMFVLSSVFISVGFAFSSGTVTAFMHDTLIYLKRDKDFTKIMGKMTANVSLISMVFILGLPFFTKYGILVPFYLSLIIDVVGIVVVFSLVSTTEKIDKKDRLTIIEVLKQAKRNHFFPIALFSGAILGFMTGYNGYRTIYLFDLGLPLIYAGVVMGLSRLVWFSLGNYAHIIFEKISMKKHLFFEIFIFSGFFIAIVMFSNFYVIATIMILVNGYQWARRQIMVKYMLDYVGDTRYKATMISLEGQLKSFFEVGVAFMCAYLFSVSYEFGFVVLGVSLFVVLVVCYHFILKHE